jgi:hypothetical protein
MKLGVSYIVFDGTELLESSINQIRKHVDFIHVIYQETSWFGKKMPLEDIAELKKLERAKLIDRLELFTSFAPFSDTSNNSIVTAKAYERNKRQAGLNRCLAEKCTHFLCMDSDEFYTSEQFKNAKDLIISKNLTSTAVKLINYVNIPTCHRGIDVSATVPFICRINPTCKMGFRGFFSRCDSTRGISNTGPKSSFLMLNPSDIIMHHMETVRRDLALKYESTTRSILNRGKINDLISNIRSVDENTKRFGFNKIIFPKSVNNIALTTVDNIFNIPYERWNK